MEDVKTDGSRWLPDLLRKW